MTGKTSLDYFNAFKRAIKAATKGGYFRQNPVDDLHGKTNPSKKLQDFLDPDELVTLVDSKAYNPEIKAAFIFSCYTGLRWCDVKTLSWSQIKVSKKGPMLVTRIIQAKTGKPVELSLHPIALAILDEIKRAWKCNRQLPQSCLQIYPVIAIDNMQKAFDLTS